MILSKRMGAFLVFVAIVGACFFFQFSLQKSHAASELSRKEVIQRCKNAVVRIDQLRVGEKEIQSLGTGFFIDDLTLVTNAHVVGELPENADKFRDVYSDTDIARSIFWVTFRDKKYRAYFIGRDPEVDLAHLKIESKILGVRPIPLGNSANIEIGDPVIVCGNPHGKENTINSGTVTGKHRKLGIVSYEDSIQTDAAINAGNSGGPMVSLEDGTVIGIVNSKTVNADNMGYAIPVDIYHSVSHDLIGTKRRSWIGIRIPNEDWRDQEGMQGTVALMQLIDGRDSVLQKIREELSSLQKGVLVVEVMRALEEPYFDATNPDSKNFQIAAFADLIPPAHRSGLKAGDIIRELNGKKVETNRDLIFALFMSKPYTSLVVRVVRFNEQGVRVELDIPVLPIVRIPASVRAGFY